MAAAKAPRINRQILGTILAPFSNENTSDSNLFLIVLAMEGLDNFAQNRPFPLLILFRTPVAISTPPKVLPFVRASFLIRYGLLLRVLVRPIHQNIRKFFLKFPVEMSTPILDFMFVDLVAIY
jgi:hypothetical protein